MSNPKDYGDGYTLGINLALKAKQITFKSVNPFKAILSPSYLKSYIAGIRDGYRQGLWRNEKQRQAERLQELSSLSMNQNRGQDKER